MGEDDIAYSPSLVSSAAVEAYLDLKDPLGWRLSSLRNIRLQSIRIREIG